LIRDILQPLPVGANIDPTEALGTLCNCLEFYVPQVLRARHPEWKYESLDGVFPFITQKIGPGEIELIGECILISDQTVVPIHIHMQVSGDRDEISWLECRLGKRENFRLCRVPYGTATMPMREILQAAEDVNAIEWFYAVTFGERRSG
jgi:hypothetical protein